MLQLQRNSNQKRGDVTDIQQISSETAKLFRWRLKKRVLCTHLHITPAAAAWPHRAMPRSSQYTVCILMLVLEEVWTGSGTSQQSIGDFWHHAHFAIIQLTADCGISKRKLEVSSIKTSLLPLVGGGSHPELFKAFDAIGLSWLTHLYNIEWKLGTVSFPCWTAEAVTLWEPQFPWRWCTPSDPPSHKFQMCI